MNAFPLHIREETFVRKFNKFPEFLEKFDQFANFEILQFFLIAISWKFIINFQMIRELKKITDPLFISVFPSFQKTDKQEFQSHSFLLGTLLIVCLLLRKRLFAKLKEKIAKVHSLIFFSLQNVFPQRYIKRLWQFLLESIS